MGGKLEYLPFVIPYALGIYGLLIAFIYYRFKSQFNQNKVRAEKLQKRHKEDYNLTPIYAFFFCESFESLYGMSDMWRILPDYQSISHKMASRLNQQG